MSEQGNELKRNLNRYIRRNQLWVFIILTVIILFLAVFIYRSFAQSTKKPAENRQEQIIKMQEQIDEQEERIKQLEEQIKQLQEKSN